MLQRSINLGLVCCPGDFGMRTGAAREHKQKASTFQFNFNDSLCLLSYSHVPLHLSISIIDQNFRWMLTGVFEMTCLFVLFSFFPQEQLWPYSIKLKVKVKCLVSLGTCALTAPFSVDTYPRFCSWSLIRCWFYSKIVENWWSSNMVIGCGGLILLLVKFYQEGSDDW